MSAAGGGLALAILDQRRVVVLVAEREPEAAIAFDMQAAAHRERPAVEPLVGGPVVGVAKLGRCDAEADADLGVEAAPRGWSAAAKRLERARQRTERDGVPREPHRPALGA